MTPRPSLHVIIWMVICLPLSVFAQSDPWSFVQKSKEGTITAYWFESRPFIYKEPNGQMTGIEFDLLEGFSHFLKQKYGVDLAIIWKEGPSFSQTYEIIRDDKSNIGIGVSAFSITESRKQEVDFSPPYMADISVMISSEDVPAMHTVDEFYAVVPTLKAITIKGTTYEQELIAMKERGDMNFEIKYIPSSENILRNIAANNKAFGFIDLPVYMMLFNEDPSIPIKRQNLFPVTREGYGFILSRNSDWKGPLAEYFSNPEFKKELEKIISKYIDAGLYRFVEGLSVKMNQNEIMLLTKEKEIQYKDLLGKADLIMKETRMNNFLVALVSVIMVSLFAIIVLYRKRNEQNEQIAAQKINIEIKSAELQQRNQHLLAIDEEKNNLIKILAHDLRTPIAHIQGLAQVVLQEEGNLTNEQKQLILQINDSSVRLGKMINHLLDIDAIENHRIRITMEEINIIDTARKVLNSFAKTASDKNIQLLFECTVPKAIVAADVILIYEIMENLVSNAIKFSPFDKEVRLIILEDEQSIRVCVKDQGPGIKSEEQANLFKKFQKLSARPTAGERSFGLGLSIVRNYVELMDGKVWCESNPGEGSVFVVQLPKPGRSLE